MIICGSSWWRRKNENKNYIKWQCEIAIFYLWMKKKTVDERKVMQWMDIILNDMQSPEILTNSNNISVTKYLQNLIVFHKYFRIHKCIYKYNFA